MRSSRTPHHLANEVRLKRTQHSGSFLLLEGPDDSRFYRRFIQPEQCHIIIAFNKDNLISAISLLDVAGFHGVLGVVDADFDVLELRGLPSVNIVRGECHDVEAMLVRSPALDAVLHEFASPEKLESFEGRFGGPLRSWLVETARCLGYLRWYSLTTGLNLCFDGLRFSRFIDARTLRLDRAALLAEIKNRSQNPALSDDELIAGGWPIDRNDDPWQVCCGHDMVELLCLALRRAIGTRHGLTTDDVARSLRLAYSPEDFSRSELRAAICQWEVNNGFQILKPIPAGTAGS